MAEALSDAEMVATRSAWLRAADRLRRSERIGFDLEADGFHRYPEQVALLQVALPEGDILIIDPLAVDELDALGEVLGDPDVPVVIHASDYDVRSLHRDFNFRVASLIDTAAAAALVGQRKTGLGNVLAEVLDVDIPKPRHLQRMDWSSRPLPEDALGYAAADVAHLLRLSDRLTESLEQLGRQDWLAEECRRLEQVRFDEPEPPEEAFLNMKGARDLSPVGRAVLRELFVVRDAEAIRVGRPPHRVVPNHALIDIASEPRKDVKLKGIPRRTLREAGDELRAAVQRGLAAEPVAWPRRGGRNPWDSDSRARLSKLREWRTGHATRLDLDIGIVWPSAHLELIALNPDTPPRELDTEDPPLVRDWQWTEMGADLEALIETF